MNDNRFLPQSSFRFLMTVIIIGFLLQVVACGGSNKPTPIVDVSVGELLVSPSGAIPPRTEVNIGINVRNVSPAFLWYAESGDNDILKGQGTSSIIYRAPRDPGTYEVRVKVTYDDESVERSVSIIVEPPTLTATFTSTPLAPTSTDIPTSPPTDTLTATRIDTPTPTVTFTPSPTPAPTATPSLPPTPTLTPLPVPVLLSPQDGGETVGLRPNLVWEWGGDLNQDPNYYYEVTIWSHFPKNRDPIDVGWTKTTCYTYDHIEQGASLELRWKVSVVRGFPTKHKDWSPTESCGEVWDPVDPHDQVSAPSEEWSHIVIVPPSPPPPKNGNNGNGGNGNGGIED